MNWNYVGTGLALIGIGLAVVLAPLPPSWWPNMPKALIQAVFAVGSVVSLIGVLLVAVGVSPVLKDKTLWPQTGMVIFALGFVFCAVWYLLVPRDGNLPGIGIYAYLRLYDTPKLSRKVVFDFASSNGSEIKFFLSKSDQFSFTISDANGEPYALEIPLGSDGIPIDRFIFLFCDAGIQESSTILRAFVDDKEVANRTLPFKLNFGKLDWQSRAIGADINGQDNAPFKIAEMGLYHKTLTSHDRSALMDNFRTYLKNIDSPLSEKRQ
jgi:hypothetical protein